MCRERRGPASGPRVASAGTPENRAKPRIAKRASVPMVETGTVEKDDLH
jgi:hypothetical protein